MKRETIVHNVGDEPITVQQADGSELTVPAGAALPADLPSEVDDVAERTEQRLLSVKADATPRWSTRATM